MQFFLILLQILPLIPGVVRAVEQIHGAGNGAAKLQSAVSLISTAVPALAPHLTADSNVSTLQRVISAVVSVMNAAGAWASDKPAPTTDKQIGS